MSRPNYTQFALDALDTTGNGGNWDTGSAEHPIRINRASSKRLDTGERIQGIGRRENHTVSVAPLSQSEFTPTGEFAQAKIAFDVSVRLEGVHTDDRGTISDYAEWKAIREECRDAIHTDREYPTSDVDTLTLYIVDGTDRSKDLKDAFRWDGRARFLGFEDMP